MKKLAIILFLFPPFLSASNFPPKTPLGIVTELGTSYIGYEFNQLPNPESEMRTSFGLGASHELQINDWLLIRSELLWEYYQGGGLHDFSVSYFDSLGIEIQTDNYGGDFTTSIGFISFAPLFKFLPEATNGHPFIEFGLKILIPAYSNEEINYEVISPIDTSFVSQSDKVSGLSKYYLALNFGIGADIEAYGTITVGFRLTYWLSAPKQRHSSGDIIRQYPNVSSITPSDYGLKINPITIKFLFAYKF